MKITILQSNFAKALNQVSRIVGNRATLPVLSNILLEADKGKIKLSATDLEVGITTQTIGKVEEDGQLTLPARLLSDFISNNKDESISVSTTGTIATLKSEHFDATIHGIAAEEFPKVPGIPKENQIQVGGELLLDAIKKVSISAATDDTRPVLAGIFFQFEDGQLVLASTDSYRLSEKKILLAEYSGDKKMIVPLKAMIELMRIISNNISETVAIIPSDNQVTFKVGDTYLVSRLIEGSFPNYSQIIPADFKITVKVKLSALLQGVKMSSLFAKDFANNNIKFGIDEKELTISSASSQVGNATAKVPAEVSGGKLEIAFNARYVIDVLNTLSDEHIILKFNDSTTSGVVSSAKDSDFTYLIMPLKIEG